MKKLIVLMLIFSIISISLVYAEDELSIGQQFHLETSFDDGGVVGQNIKFGRKTVLYKRYTDRPNIKLLSESKLDISLTEVVNNRLSTRTFSKESLSFADLSSILLIANGLTHKRGGLEMRSVPSGGALYPIDIYILVSNVDNLDAGLYHFQVADSSLEQLKTKNFDDFIHQACNRQKSVGFSPATLIIAARFDRSTAKYADRGYRYTYIEAGAICQNIYLGASALKLGTVAVGAFNDKMVNEFLDFDGIREAVLLMMPLGHLIIDK